MSFYVVSVLVQLVELAVVVRIEVLVGVALFLGSDSIASHRVVVLQLFFLGQTLEEFLVPLAVLFALLLNILELVFRAIVVDQHGLLDCSVQQEGSDTAKHWRQKPADNDLDDATPLDHCPGICDGVRYVAGGHGCTDDATDDGVGGGDRPAHHCCDQQPQCCADQRGEHDVGKVHRHDVDALEVNNAGLDGVRDFAAGEQRATDFEDCCNKECLLHGQGSCAHGGAEGVGDVIAADVEGHETAQDDGDNHECHVGTRVDVVLGPENKPDEGGSGHQAEEQVPRPVIS